MKLSPLVLAVVTALACLATSSAIAGDQSQAAVNNPTMTEIPDGALLDKWSRNAASFSEGNNFAAVKQTDLGIHHADASGNRDTGRSHGDTAGATSVTTTPAAKKPMPYTFRYEHKHKTHANTTIEKLELARAIGHGFTVSLAQEWLPRAKADKSAGDAFHDLEPYKTRFDINYSRKLSHNLTFKHRFRNDFKRGKWELKPRFQLQVKVADNFTVTPGYERVNTFNDGKANVYQNQVSMALEYKWRKFKYKYTREDFYSTGRVIYNNTTHNYKNKYVVGYSSGQFEPYLEVRNVSRSSTKPGRDDDIRLGVKYRF